GKGGGGKALRAGNGGFVSVRHAGGQVDPALLVTAGADPRLLAVNRARRGRHPQITQIKQQRRGLLVVAVNVGRSAAPPVARYRSGRGRQTTTAAPSGAGRDGQDLHQPTIAPATAHSRVRRRSIA